jgi:hypothetical protein
MFKWFRKAPPKLPNELENLFRQFVGGQALAVAIAQAVRDHVAEVEAGRATFPAHRNDKASVVRIWHDLRLQALSRMFNFGKADAMLLGDPTRQVELLSCFLDERPHLGMPQPRGDTIPDTIQAMWQVYVALDTVGSEVADRETDRARLKSQGRDILTNITVKATSLRRGWADFRGRLSAGTSPPKWPETLLDALYADVTAKTKSIALSAKFGPNPEEMVEYLEAKLRETGTDPRQLRESYERVLRASDPADVSNPGSSPF